MYDGELEYWGCTAESVTVIGGTETYNGEMINTQKICVKSQLGRSRRRWIVKERQYEDLDLRFNNFSVQIIKLRVFAPLL